MIEALQETISKITGGNNETLEQDDSLETVDNSEVLVTARGIANATERHLNEHELDYDVQIGQMGIALDFGLTITANSIYSLFLLGALKGITASFTPIPFHIITGALNLALGSLLLSNEKISKVYATTMIVARIGLTCSVNGVIIGTINERVDISKKTEETIIQQIDDFNGVEPPQTNPLTDILAGAVALILMGGVGIKMIYAFFTKGNTT